MFLFLTLSTFLRVLLNSNASVFSLQEAGLTTDRAWAEPRILDVQRTVLTLLKQTNNNWLFWMDNIGHP